MGSCTNKLFDVGLRNLKFKLKTNVDGDAFCPTTILITLYDDVGKIYRYKADGMNDRVEKDLYDHIRDATKLEGTCMFYVEAWKYLFLKVETIPQA